MHEIMIETETVFSVKGTEVLPLAPTPLKGAALVPLEPGVATQPAHRLLDTLWGTHGAS